MSCTTRISLSIFAFLSLAVVSSSEPTFYKDVLPILQANCQECHREHGANYGGMIAPMSLRTYAQVRPWAKAFAESFIGTIKRECLNHFMCFSRDQLDYITSTWVGHYNTERPHRGFGMNNEVLDRTFRRQHHGTIRCKQ